MRPYPTPSLPAPQTRPQTLSPSPTRAPQLSRRAILNGGTFEGRKIVAGTFASQPAYGLRRDRPRNAMLSGA